jgi:hypothetical protein
MARGRSRLMRALVKARKRTSIMWAFIEDLYREYCLARLQEMRKYALRGSQARRADRRASQPGG